MAAELIIQSGKYQGKRLNLSSKDVVVGRQEGCQIRLPHGDVSKEHCRIRRTENGATVEDLGSSNGTFVNEVLITQLTELKAGDKLRVGPMEFLFSTGKKSNPAAAATKKKKAKKPSSDDSIMSWLAEDEEAGSGDTTIVKATAEELKEPVAKKKTEQVLPVEPKSTNMSVAEEAADIIKRWWQQQEAG